MQATAGVVLAMEADASAVSLAIAWALERAGEPEVWSALATWRSHVRLAQASAAEMRDSGDLARATGAAFVECYEIDWMSETCCVAAGSAYLDRQDATHALPNGTGPPVRRRGTHHGGGIRSATMRQGSAPASAAEGDATGLQRRPTGTAASHRSRSK
jgi:hypothetical protein